MKILRILLSIAIICLSINSYASKNIEISEEKCIDISEKKSLLGGWYFWPPYQFNQITAGGNQLAGMDIELARKLAEKVGTPLDYQGVDWGTQQQDLKNGTRDIATGATYTEDRAEFVYFSLPYRFEENSLFMLHDNLKTLQFNNTGEYLAQIRLQNFRLGVIKGFIYASPKINSFISDKFNQDIVISYSSDLEALQALVRGEIDGYMSDRIVGAATIFNQKVSFKTKEISLDLKTPIHLMFSKKTVPVEMVDRFNSEIRNFVQTAEYKNIIKTYLYPVMLMQTIGSNWFYFIGVIGTLGFALSGIAIAVKENSTLFGTFLLAMIPSVGGGIMRDILINRNEVGIFLTPSYIYYILIMVLIGFSSIRLLEYYNRKAYEDEDMSIFLQKIIMLGDSIGQSAFIVTGVSITIMAKIEPIELWGPFLAFLTANGGVIIRDLLRKDRYIVSLSGFINAEISIFWGLVFSIYLDFNSYNPSQVGIRNAVILIAIGAFISQLVCFYVKIPNLRFRSETQKP